MPKCCADCFNDQALKEKIQIEGTFSRCGHCATEGVLTVNPEILADLFELSIDCLLEDEDGQYPHVIYLEEFLILSRKSRNPSKLIEEILGTNFSHRKYRLKYNTTKYTSEWNKFKKELTHKNRFFPKENIYSQVFSHSSNNVESNSFVELIGKLKIERDANDEFFRARISDIALTNEKMGMPPKELASAGRANPIGISYLYLAENIETCVKEVRPNNGEQVYVSKLIAKRELSLIDLTNPKQKVSLLKYEENEIELVLKHLNLLELFSSELSKPITPKMSHLEYIPTQFMCEYLKTVGNFDGLIFTSSFGKGNNIVLFNADAMEIEQPIVHQIQAVDVHYTAL